MDWSTLLFPLIKSRCRRTFCGRRHTTKYLSTLPTSTFSRRMKTNTFKTSSTHNQYKQVPSHPMSWAWPNLKDLWTLEQLENLIYLRVRRGLSVHSAPHWSDLLGKKALVQPIWCFATVASWMDSSHKNLKKRVSILFHCPRSFGKSKKMKSPSKMKIKSMSHRC